MDSYHIFCSDNISNEQLQEGTDLIHQFVDAFEDLYGINNMVRNIFYNKIFFFYDLFG